MLRKLPVYAICLFVAAPLACTKSEEDFRRAQRAASGLMPDNDPKFEAEYVADQSQVKIVAPRTVSYEPLDTFRGKAAESKDEATAAEPAPARSTAGAAPRPRGTPTAAPAGGGGNFWSRVGMKALMGGAGAPPGPRPAAPGSPAPKSDEPAGDEEAAQKEDDAAADEEEPAEDEEAESEEEETEEGGSEEEPKEETPDKVPRTRTISAE